VLEGIVRGKLTTRKILFSPASPQRELRVACAQTCTLQAIAHCRRAFRLKRVAVRGTHTRLDFLLALTRGRSRL
jgi:hypothetical protein